VMFGYDRDELLGQSVEILLPERFRGAAGHAAASQVNPLARLVGTNLELYGLRKDGSEFPVEIGLSPSQLDGELLVTSIIADMTERKRLEEELRRAQRLEMAGRIASQVAHDFNNLLSPLRGYPELIKLSVPADDFMVPLCDEMLDTVAQMVEI